LGRAKEILNLGLCLKYKLSNLVIFFLTQGSKFRINLGDINNWEYYKKMYQEAFVFVKTRYGINKEKQQMEKFKKIKVPTGIFALFAVCLVSLFSLFKCSNFINDKTSFPNDVTHFYLDLKKTNLTMSKNISLKIPFCRYSFLVYEHYGNISIVFTLNFIAVFIIAFHLIIELIFFNYTFFKPNPSSSSTKSSFLNYFFLFLKNSFFFFIISFILWCLLWFYIIFNCLVFDLLSLLFYSKHSLVSFYDLINPFKVIKKIGSLFPFFIHFNSLIIMYLLHDRLKLLDLFGAIVIKHSSSRMLNKTTKLLILGTLLI